MLKTNLFWAHCFGEEEPHGGVAWRVGGLMMCAECALAAAFLPHLHLWKTRVVCNLPSLYGNDIQSLTKRLVLGCEI